jgi:hypothetical protein
MIILVEGIAGSSDERFIKACIKHWFGGNHENTAEFQFMKGVDEFEDFAVRIKRTIDKQKLLMIVDANGKPEKRKTDIVEFQKKHDWHFPFFLFPNNKDKGEIETLLVKIATQKDKLKCFEDYEKCINQSLDIKDKIYAYITACTGNKEAARDKNRDFSSGHFDLDSPALDSLKEFLTPHFS